MTSDAQKLIEQTLVAAIKDQTWTCDSAGLLIVDGHLNVKELAVAVDKALGGLTREWATEFDSWYRGPRGEKRDYVEHFDYKGDEHSARDHARTSLRVRLVTRFVSGWTVTE